MDVRETADFLHGKGVPLIVDSTTSTPYLLNPIQYGADVVVHSTSKYIKMEVEMPSVEIIIDSGNFPGVRNVIPGMKEYKKYGKFAYLVETEERNLAKYGRLSGSDERLSEYYRMMETLGDFVWSGSVTMRSACSGTGSWKVYLSIIHCWSPVHIHELAEKQLSGKGGAILTIHYRFQRTGV